MRFPRLHKSELAELGLYALTVALIVAACTLVYGCQQASGAVPVLVEPVEDRVSVIHLEHFYDGCGRLVFDQHIFIDLIDYHPSGMIEEVVAWRLVKAPDQIVYRDSGGFALLWQDGERLRLVRADSYRETWSQTDSELAARDWMPVDERRGLRYERTPTTNPPFVREIPAEGP